MIQTDARLMRVLALCAAGTVRSGGLVLAAKRRGLDALQAGVDFNAPGTLAMLAEWADVIVVAEGWMTERVIETQRSKVWDAALGGDRWHNPLNPELEALCDSAIGNMLKAGGT